VVARTWWDVGNRSGAGFRRRSSERGRLRRRLLSPAPESLEDRTLLAGSLPAGSLDTTFNQTGLVTAQVGLADAGGAGALQPDDKIVVAGSATGSGGSQTIALVRYLPDGRLDTGFGPARNGVVALDPRLEIDAAHAVAVASDPGQPDDGRIVVAGTWSDPRAANPHELALVGFNADGTLNSEFGTAGVVLDTTVPNAQGVALAIQPDGSIVVGGISSSGTNDQPIEDAFVERFTGSGSPDTTFAAKGLDVPLFSGISSTIGGLAVDSHGDVIVAGEEQSAAGTAQIAVARLKSDGTLDPSFGSGGIVTTDLGSDAVLQSVAGVVIDPSRGVLVAGTARATASTHEVFLVARYNLDGNLDANFNHGAVEFINSQQLGESDDVYARALVVQLDGKIVLAGYTPVPAVGQLESVGPVEFTLARLNPDATPDIAFGQRGQVVTDLATPSRTAQSLPQSVLVQPDGNIVVTGEAFDTVAGQAFSAFAVARYVGTVEPGSATIPAGSYVEDFSNDADPTKPGFDGTGVFQHTFWYNAQPEGPSSTSDVEGSGWDLGSFPGSDGAALHLTAATDTITFPNLRADVHVGLASVDVTALTDAYVTFVGDSGTYTVHVGTGDDETVSAGESHVLKADGDGNPILELGPIREIILDSDGAFFDNVKVLAIPGQGPLDDFVTVRPDKPTAIDILDYATGAAPDGALIPPLALESFTQPSLLGSQTTISPSDPGQVVYTPGKGQGKHPTDSFTYTVEDANGKTGTGTVYVTLDMPPQFADIQHNFPSTATGGGWDVPRGTPGPLTGVINLSDAEQDPVTLTVLNQLSAGTITVTKISDYQYSYSDVLPTTYAYDPSTGLTTSVSAIVGNEQFTLEASDGLSSADYTVRFFVPDLPPYSPTILPIPKSTPPNTDFVVPENTGAIYYPTDPSDPNYDRVLAYPGLVHFAAPGVLWNASDPDGDPLRALADPSHLPQHGVLALFADGSFNYTPAPGFTGVDTFSYYANDGYLSGVDLDHPSVPAPFYVTIHVAAGQGQNSFLPGRVLLDDHYHLQLPAHDSAGGLAPAITGNDHAAGAGSGYNPIYPFMPVLIRPLHPAGKDPDGTQRFVLTDVDSALSAFYGQKMIFNDLGIYYQYAGNSLTVYLGPYLHLVQPPQYVAIAVLDIEQTTTAIVVPTDFSFTYAFMTKDGWFSNFAGVVLHVDPVGSTLGSPENSVTVYAPGGQPVEVGAPLGTTLNDVSIVTPLPSGAPGDIGVPWLISFALSYPPSFKGGFPVQVIITLPPGSPHFTTYYKYGHQAPGDDPHWYRFVYDAGYPDVPGAELVNDRTTGFQTIILHLTDGAVGDDDLTKNGVIVDPGGPGFFTDPARNFVASLYEDVLGRSPSDAEMAHWVQKLDRGGSRLKVAQAVWDLDEHRRLQVDQWSMQFLGYAADPLQQAQWVKLLRRGRGEIAVEQAILTSPEYRRAHPTTASFVAGLNHNVLNQAGDPVDPAQGRLRRHRKSASIATLAREVLTSAAAAATLAQQDATTFLGRPATSQETHADELILRRDPSAPERIAEQILASDAFYEFVNSALPPNLQSPPPDRHVHDAAQHPRRQ